MDAFKNSKKKIKEVFESYGVKVDDRGRWFFLPCPFHDEKQASLALYFDKYIYYCFGCKAKGTLEGLLAKISGKSPLVFAELFSDLVPQHRKPKEKIQELHVNLNEIHGLYKRGEDIANAYLLNRGIKNPEVFQCGYDAVSNRLIIPLYYDEQLQGFEARTLQDDSYKYKALYFEKGNYFYGWDDLDWSLDFLTIVESSISAMYLMNNFGLKNVVALMGSALTTRRQELINEFKPKRLNLWLDNDRVGRETATTIAEKFRYSTDIFSVVSKGDPDEVKSMHEIQLLHITEKEN